MDLIVRAEDKTELRAFGEEHAAKMARIVRDIREKYGVSSDNDSDGGNPEYTEHQLASIIWSERAALNAPVPTTLSRLGTTTSARLIRHGFVLAMAKLHLRLGYPLCEIPPAEEFERLAGGSN